MSNQDSEKSKSTEREGNLSSNQDSEKSKSLIRGGNLYNELINEHSTPPPRRKKKKSEPESDQTNQSDS